jgi:hypothetical protein
VRSQLPLLPIALDARPVQTIGTEVQSMPVQVWHIRLQASAFRGMRAVLTSLDDPFEHPHVLGETRLCELPALVGAKPPDAENAGRRGTDLPIASQC